jgi:hypothetical protein
VGFLYQDSVMADPTGGEEENADESVEVVATQEGEKSLVTLKGDRRRSERLKKDIQLTMEEKNNIQAKKKNLEGNSYITANHVSSITNEHVVDLSVNMGVKVCENIFSSSNLIKDLELDRIQLGYKNEKSDTHSNLRKRRRKIGKR